ncbi:phenylacetaldoxime dehydratase family protein [Streptomyces griseoruber]|uniref:phenylacetaldoxime dehydratase family protein n=1 Tax=Streptomyces griseoruber TaxID=1943 RepID=UPI0007C761AB|nr:phenylacetaldoxime dehydratase family protein [Streptomyces griseoruber]
MESAIDSRLKCPRTLSRRVSGDYAPPFPMFVARGDKALQQVVMAYFGVQYSEEGKRPQALAALGHIVESFGLADGPVRHDLTDHVDNQDHHNLMAVAYWADPAAYCRWLRSDDVRAWWESQERLTEDFGYFREVVAPRVEQFETLYAFTEDFPGIGGVMGQCSDEIEEHGYWGSMRDRIPLSQTDRLEPFGVLEIASGDPAVGGRVIVRGHDNIALIRSGQDWMAAGEDERALSFDEFLPTLEAGMVFLQESGGRAGCYSNRFVRSIDIDIDIDIDGNELDGSYNIGHWRSLDALKRWAESHPARLPLFVMFLRAVTSLENLRFYREVSVSDGKDQTFEYINCHPRTGVMRDAVIPAGGERPPQAVTRSDKAEQTWASCSWSSTWSFQDPGTRRAASLQGRRPDIRPQPRPHHPPGRVSPGTTYTLGMR